jgi:exodeoxyribonuclease V beta subunit
MDSSGLSGSLSKAAPFDARGPLPSAGITVIEASAGTGKTFSLTALVVRFVADGVPLDAILAVTFTRMATGELRDRVRRRLVEVHDGLARYVSTGEAVPAGDEVAAHLACGDPADVKVRLDRLSDAVASFDSATIATTHSFCQVVLAGLGTAGDVAAGATLLEDPAELISDVVDDLYLRWALRHGPPPFSRQMAGDAAATAVANPDIVLSPPGGDSAGGLLSRLASRARDEVARRLQERDLLTYDQLLARLAATLQDGERGRLACRRLRQRYQVVLIDEFQDTDPIQWRVMWTAFGQGDTTLILVGDPKQAIYSFRGADVRAYLEAANLGVPFTLTQNWRADQCLLDATSSIMSPLHFGDEQITFRSVKATPDRQRPGIRGLPCASPVRVRLVADNQRGIDITPARRLLQKQSLADWIANDVAADIARTLDAKPEIRDPGVEFDGWRRVVPADIAVLTRTNRQSLAVRDALRAAGVPAVVSGLDSAFSSPAAKDWLRLLEALQEPASRPRAVAFALTPFIGMDAATAAGADENRWDSVHARIHSWAAVLSRVGVAGLYRVVTASEGLPARVLGVSGGERYLTDLTHVAHLLHSEATVGRSGAPSLRAWLAQRIEEAATEQADFEERSRRLDSDADAVQVLTVHRAKGLEFGVVYCPYLWDAANAGGWREPVIFHDPESGLARTLDVGCAERGGPAERRFQANQMLALAEQRGEDLRLMYVALTRACHQVVMWWGRADKSRHSPLGRVLMCRDPETGAVGDAKSREPSDRDIRAALGTLAGRADRGLISIETCTTPARAADPASMPISPLGAATELEAARFDRALDEYWQRASYTSITAAAHALHQDGTGRVGSEPEDPGVGDEPAQPGPPLAAAAAWAGPGGAAPASPLSGVAGGAAVGTFVHQVLEQIDFAAGDVAVAITEAIARAAPPPEISGDRMAAPALVTGLVAALDTPLGPLLPDVTLRDIRRGDRLDELGFELPLAGGDRPVGQVSTADVAALLARHRRVDDPLADYAERLADPILSTELRGYLTGSLDLVFRRRHAGSERWFVADYKTNWLGDEGHPLTVWHYRPEALDAEMQRRHYPLQALLYLVALHRYLRWRLPGYTPDEHLGGVLYLFLRGMAGQATPTVQGHPCGVFSWAPPPQLIVGLSDLFELGGAR